MADSRKDHKPHVERDKANGDNGDNAPPSNYAGGAKTALIGVALVAAAVTNTGKSEAAYKPEIAEQISEAAAQDQSAISTEKVGLQKLLDELGKLRLRSESGNTELSEFAREFSQFAREFSQFAREP